MMTSVLGDSFCAATRVAKTSCTKGSLQASASPMPAEPEMASTAWRPVTSLSMRRSTSAALPTMWEKCRS